VESIIQEKERLGEEWQVHALIKAKIPIKREVSKRESVGADVRSIRESVRLHECKNVWDTLPGVK
jgi:hypothetical protein